MNKTIKTPRPARPAIRLSLAWIVLIVPLLALTSLVRAMANPPILSAKPQKLVRASAGKLIPVTGMNLENTGNPSIDLDQCRNGPTVSPNPCQALGSNQGWVNGNVSGSQGHLAEGYSIPYRAIMQNLPLYTLINLQMGYDIKNSGAHSLDFLTHYNRLEPHLPVFGHPAEEVSPTSGVSSLSSTISTYPIPAPSAAGSPVPGQPEACFNSLPADQRPSIEVRKTAFYEGKKPAEVPETGGLVTFTFVVTNLSTSEPVRITSLSDDKLGDLNGQEDCITGGWIPVGGSYSCTLGKDGYENATWPAFSINPNYGRVLIPEKWDHIFKVHRGWGSQGALTLIGSDIIQNDNEFKKNPLRRRLDPVQ